jgi:hypothetical protein
MDTHLLKILKEYQEKNKMVTNSTIKDFDETSIMAILVVCAYIVTILYYASLNKICASHIYYVH